MRARPRIHPDVDPLTVTPTDARALVERAVIEGGPLYEALLGRAGELPAEAFELPAMYSWPECRDDVPGADDGYETANDRLAREIRAEIEGDE